MNKTELTPIEQEKEQVAKELIELNGKILHQEDGPKAMLKFGKSQKTIQRYLEGKIGELALGKMLVEFFNECVLNRSNKFQTTQA